MTESSAYWDGTTTGHAAAGEWGAPYSSLEYSDINHKVWASLAPYALVLPAYSDKLAITENSPAAMSVIVRSGAALIAGKIYENDSIETLSIAAADATNPRLDRVVIRISYTAQTIVLAILTGTPAATPSLPALTQNSTTYEIAIGYVWVAASATTITNTEIHDERLFATSPISGILLTHENLIRNSEFLAFSDLSRANPTTETPDYWNLVLTPSAIAPVTKPAQMPRGRAIQLTSNAANEGMSQTVPCKASTFYSIKFLINVSAGDVGGVVITTDAASPTTVTKNIRRTGAWIEYTVYYTTESDATLLTLQLLCVNSGDIIQVGQVLLVEGYSTGIFREIHETLLFEHGELSDTDFDGGAKALGTYTIDLTSDYGPYILPGTKAVQVRMSMTNSSGAAQSVYFYANSDTNRVLLRQRTQTTSPIDIYGWVALWQGRYLYVNVLNNNFTSLFIRITGIQT